MTMLSEIVRKQRWLAEELPRLRRQIEEEVRAQTHAEHGLDAVIAAAFAEPYDRTTGKTIGLRIPDDLRLRLEAQAGRGADSYSHLVMVAIRVGVAAMENAPTTVESEDVEPEQEPVHHDADEHAEEDARDPDLD